MPAHPDGAPEDRSPDPRFVGRSALRATVVERTDGPDRRTVYPVGVDDEAQLTTWLSADADAFVDPRDVR